MMCTFLVQVTVEANHPIAGRHKCWHTGDSRAGTSSPMQIFVKTLTGKTITLDPWWNSKFQTAGCGLRQLWGARSCKVMSCFAASWMFSSLVPVARLSHPYCPNECTSNGWFQLPLTFILWSTLFSGKWHVFAAFFERLTATKHFTAIIHSDSWSDGSEMARTCPFEMWGQLQCWQLYMMTCNNKWLHVHAYIMHTIFLSIYIAAGISGITRLV